ncbi:MAG: hypothetical protein RL536_476 [Candidatus Parcubacteria bacterium]|jgi:periplasmic protein TonB
MKAIGIAVAIVLGIILLAYLLKPLTRVDHSPYRIDGPQRQEPLDNAHEMPVYPGGESALMADIHSEMEYPEMERKNGIQGKVYVQFVVEENGAVSDVKVVRGVSGSKNLEEEAVRVVRNLKRFAPARRNGKPERITMTIPINFHLN